MELKLGELLRMAREEPEKLLATLEVPPYSEKYPEEEKRKFREALGITTCSECLLKAFVLDVLLPPPFRPPLMLVACFATRTCP
jgi:hypothetical protein